MYLKEGAAPGRSLLAEILSISLSFHIFHPFVNNPSLPACPVSLEKQISCKTPVTVQRLFGFG